LSTQAKLQLDPLEQLKTFLEDAPRSYSLLSNYVRAMEWHQDKEDIFIQHAFDNANAGVAYPPRTGSLIVTFAFSELYEPLGTEHKLEITRWWHEMVRGKAIRFTDLKARLSKLT
jgi:hypothetical protein